MKTPFQIFFSVFILVVAALVLPGCKASNKITVANRNYPSFFKIGHRGTRGLMPENTIAAMKKGIEVGANTIEFDVHITKEGNVIVYHDDTINPDYTVKADGTEIPKEERKNYSFYQMDYQQIHQFVIGTKRYAPFPQQQLVPSSIPLLSTMIDSVEAYTKANHFSPVYYLLEIKSNEKTDGIDQPVPEEFVTKLMTVLKPEHLGNRLIIQSFDRRPLQVVHKKYPGVALGYLTGDLKGNFENDIQNLGFLPAFYNPNELMVTAELIKKCHEKNILIAPWTVNSMASMKKFKAMGVDGIITDYPNLLQEIE